MENTILITLKTVKARALIRDLEDLNIIEVIKENIVINSKMSDRFKGLLTKNEGENLKKHINQSREEWSNI
jgi:ribosomal protein L12E/L44/L45/RPP1/RPP2